MKNNKILIIEDDVDLLKLLASYLKANGYEVLTSPESEDGVTLAERERPNLIILDIKMPGKGGLSAYKDIRYSPNLASVPIILMSGLSKEAVQAIAEEIKANDFVHKPFEPEELIKKIKENIKE
jgi:DNA-binding response OmpR family regulator